MEFGILDMTVIRSVEVFNAKPARLRFRLGPGGPNPTPRWVRVNGQTELITADQSIMPCDKKAENRILRLRVLTLDDEGEVVNRLIFARPGKVLPVNLFDPGDSPEERLLASYAYYSQLQMCVLYHMTESNTETEIPIQRLREDLEAIRTAGVDAEVVALRDKYVDYFRDVQEKSKSALGTLAVNLAFGAIQAGLQVVITRTAPSNLDVLQQTLTSLCETAYDRYQLSSELRALTNRLSAAENTVNDLLLDRLATYPALKEHPFLRETRAHVW
jgi:hypothetical protein